MNAHTFRRCWRSFTAVALSVIAASCADSNVVSPAFDAAHNSVPAVGAVTWLAPLGTGYAGARTFDAKAVTRLEVCVWNSGACSGAPVASFSTNGSGAGLLRINNYEGRYEAVLNLLDPAFTTRKTYRIRAMNGTNEVGGYLVDIASGQYAFGRTDGIQNPLGAANDLSIQFHVALVPPPMIRINEVESNGGTPGDWVELFNAGETAVDISGYVFKDNDDTHAYAIPSGTVVPVGGYYVLEEAAFDFGLGGAESARLFTPGGALADSYSWATHAATTYGRCGNGTGAFIAMPTVTKGTANDCLTPNTIKINEVESNGGTPGDWVELYNSSAIPIDLSGWVLKDNDVSRGYVIPTGTVIRAGGYYVIEEAAMGFGLGAIDETLLFDNTGGQRDWYSWATHATTSYGRCANGVGAFITMTTVTKGAGNSCPVIGTLKINEAESNGGTPGDWVELKNIGTTPLDVSGFVFKDNDDTHVYIIPNNTTIAAGGYLVLDESQFVFGLGADETVRIFDQGGALIDSYSWTAHATSTYGRCPDGTGPFTTMTTVTKGATNDCSVPNTVKFNEVESNGGTPGDWAELYNSGAVAVDLSGFVFKDNDDSHAYTLPSGSIVPAGGYFLIEEAQMGFGLGSPDAVRLFDKQGAVVDSYAWTPHATTTYGRCPNATGAFTTTTSSTKGAANDCSVASPIKINEVESNGGTPGDWVELLNTSGSAVDISGFIFRDNDDTHKYVIPAGTSIAAGGYYMLEEAAFGFGLGADESARLYNATDALVDSYSWLTHAATTYGRCPNGTGSFALMATSTKGALNDCGGPVTPTVEAWPGLDNVTPVDVTGTFSSNMSGLKFEAGATDVLWAARNGPGSIYRMIFNGTNWVPDQTNGWGSGKLTKFMDGTGEPDTEDLTYTTGSAAGMYIVSERNNAANGVSRPSVLRYDVTATSATLVATNEWLLTADLPVVAANSGLEAITWIPDSYLVAQGFFDVAKNHKYNPAEYPNGGGGLFFVGLEGNGVVYVYSLNHADNTFTRITSFSTGFPSGVMALQFDLELGQLWAVCDDTCGGLSNIYVIDVTAGSATLGRMKLTHVFGRAPSMPNINNEGFTISPQSMCVNGMKPAFWSDDSSTGGNAIRRASIPCVKFP